MVATPTKVVVGHSSLLSCNVIRSNPAVLSYKWIHEETGTLLSTNRTFVLIFSSAQDFGTFQCIATNIIGASNGTVLVEGGREFLTIKYNYYVNKLE